jgi:predicted porin
MHKKLMAVAVVTALAAPAAALAQVTIGGGVNLLYLYHDSKNNNVATPSDYMQSSESELTIRGEDKLGGGISTWIQCGTSIDGIISGNAATVAGMCTRNSAIGFRGGFGNVFFGNWDTPSKLVQNQVRGWFSGTNALYGGGATLLWGGSASGVVNPVQTVVASPVVGGTTGAATANGGSQAYSMYRRQAQSLNYHSPNWGGFVVQAAYSAGNESSGIADTSSPKFNPRLAGISGQYRLGGLWVGLAYEQHTDYNPGNTSVGIGVSQYGGGTDTNITLGVGYTFAGRFKVTGAYSETEYEVNNSQTLEVKGYALYGEFNIAGPHHIKAAYITVLDTEGTAGQNVGAYKATGNTNCGISGTASCASDTGATVYTIAYAYDFSKRTQGLISYNVMDNDPNATFNQGIVASTIGGKQTSYGIAIRHSF